MLKVPLKVFIHFFSRKENNENRKRAIKGKTKTEQKTFQRRIVERVVARCGSESEWSEVNYAGESESTTNSNCPAARVMGINAPRPTQSQQLWIRRSEPARPIDIPLRQLHLHRRHPFHAVTHLLPHPSPACIRRSLRHRPPLVTPPSQPSPPLLWALLQPPPPRCRRPAGPHCAPWFPPQGCHPLVRHRL